jgi:hypothetical protein
MATGSGADPDLPKKRVRLPGTWFPAPDTCIAAACASLLPNVGANAVRRTAEDARWICRPSSVLCPLVGASSSAG